MCRLLAALLHWRLSASSLPARPGFSRNALLLLLLFATSIQGGGRAHLSAYVSIRQHTSAMYGLMLLYSVLTSGA
jgi:hypothetical protein